MGTWRFHPTKPRSFGATSLRCSFVPGTPSVTSWLPGKAGRRGCPGSGRLGGRRGHALLCSRACGLCPLRADRAWAPEPLTAEKPTLRHFPRGGEQLGDLSNC